MSSTQTTQISPLLQQQAACSPSGSPTQARRSILLNSRNNSLEPVGSSSDKASTSHREHTSSSQHAHPQFTDPFADEKPNAAHTEHVPGIQWNPDFNMPERPHTHHTDGSHLKFAPLPQVNYEGNNIRRKSLGSASSHNHPKQNALYTQNSNDLSAMMQAQIARSGVVPRKPPKQKVEQVTVKDIAPGMKKLFKRFQSPPQSPKPSSKGSPDIKKGSVVKLPSSREQSEDEDDQTSETSSLASVAESMQDDEDIKDDELFDEETIQNTDLNTLASLHALHSPHSLSRTVSRSISSRRPSAATGTQFGGLDTHELSKKLQAEEARALRFEREEELPKTRFEKFEGQWASRLSSGQSSPGINGGGTNQQNAAGIEKTSARK